MKGEWNKTVRVEFETVIGYKDAYVQADVDVSGWWDEGRMYGENAYPPESGWQIDSVDGFIEIYDNDGGIDQVIPFSEYNSKLDAEIEYHVSKELDKVFS